MTTPYMRTSEEHVNRGEIVSNHSHKNKNSFP